MRNIYNTFLLCVYWMNYGITGIQLLGCGSNGFAEVSEKSNFTLTCDGFDAKNSVSWQIENNEGGKPFPAGTCPCCTCTDTLPGLPVSRTNATVSQLTVMSSRTWDNYRFTCFITGSPSQKSSCLIQAMYPADVTSCSVVINSGSLNISGSCTVSKVFTSSNIYKCTWYRGTSPVSQTTLITNTTYTPVIHPDPNYRQGTCTFTTAFDLPLVTGSYYYKVVVDPGGTEKQFGPLDIERPFEPTIVCTPSPYVQENTNINCNCKTTNIGNPGGYLTWSRESNGKVNIINNGSYSGTSLTMIPQVLNASDHNATVLQCAVVWMNITIKGGFYIATLSSGKDGDNPGNDTKINYAAIGGGIAAGVAVIVIIIVVITIILKRRNEGKKDPQKIESPPAPSSATDKQGIVKKTEPPKEENQSANHARSISNLPLLMQPPVMHPRTKSKHDQYKRKKGKKSEKRKDCKDGEYENAAFATKTSAGDTKRKAHQNENKNTESHINNEGITYMELDFSQNKDNKIVKPPPAEEHVEYAPIDFSKHVS